jgi:hypothetical protein
MGRYVDRLQIDSRKVPTYIGMDLLLSAIGTLICTVGEIKLDRSFGVNISAPRYARNLKLIELDLSGPQVVASQFSASYIKNSDLHDSLNKVETIGLNQFHSLKN